MRIAILVLMLIAHPATAEIRVSAMVVSAYDGDTFTVDAEIWPSVVWHGAVRVSGVDTPEIRGQCEEEKARARAARDFVRELLIGKTVILAGVKHGKYAKRVVATVLLADGSDLANVLIATGHGRAYDGGRREKWC